MACTNHSAKQYIRKARGRLVGKLENVSVIVENLYQRKVLNEEEVSKINAECDDFDKTRKILDWVTNKGEDACYELLKIIDITRKRTLKRPVEQTGPSQDSVEFDLHCWISCFSFREDTDLQTNYSLGKLLNCNSVM